MWTTSVQVSCWFCCRLRDDDRKDPAVVSYLEAENSYTTAAMADTEALQAELYKEMRARIKEDDTSVATRSVYTHHKAPLDSSGLPACSRDGCVAPAAAAASGRESVSNAEQHAVGVCLISVPKWLPPAEGLPYARLCCSQG